MVPGQFSDTFCLDFLVANQNADGGWGFHPATPSAVEATAWSVLALLSSRPDTANPDACRRAGDWLLKTQLADGSWPALPGQAQGCWVTALAAHAMHVLGGAKTAVERGRDWILGSWPAEHNLWWRAKQAIFPNRAAQQNSALSGWSWTPRTASWVEPTAHALLFLRALPAEMLPPLATKRRKLAESMLFDRMCPGGGWNSGNPLVYGVGGVPRIGPTAWALMALRDHANREEVQMSLNVLEQSNSDIKAAGSLALATRCLTLYKRRSASSLKWVQAEYEKNHFFKNILTFAWVLLAVNESEPIPSLSSGTDAIR